MNPRTTSGPDNVRGPADECKKPGAPSSKGPRCGCGAVSGVHYCPNVNPPTRPAHGLTPSEVGTARALAAWVDSPAPREDEPGNALRMLGTGLILDGLALPDRSPTDGGADLLDRARKAGVL